MTRQEISDALERLIEKGLAEPAGVDESGEVTFQITQKGFDLCAGRASNQ